MNIEKVISTFEKIISVCKEDGCDFVDLTFEDAEQILAMLKEQNDLMLALDQSNAANGYLNAEVERLNGLLKEQEAEWLEVDDKHDAFDCSNCGAMAGRKCLYCPGCGAKMKNGTRAMEGR